MNLRHRNARFAERTSERARLTGSQKTSLGQVGRPRAIFPVPGLISSLRASGNSRRKPGLLFARVRERQNLLALDKVPRARVCPYIGWNGTYQCPLRRICHSRVPRRVSRCPEAFYCKSGSTLRVDTPCSTDPDISLALPGAAKISSPITGR